jgi:hypothetical protein
VIAEDIADGRETTVVGGFGVIADKRHGPLFGSVGQNDAETPGIKPSDFIRGARPATKRPGEAVQLTRRAVVGDADHDETELMSVALAPGAFAMQYRVDVSAGMKILYLVNGPRPGTMAADRPGGQRKTRPDQFVPQM